MNLPTIPYPMVRTILLFAFVVAPVFALRNNSKLSAEKFNVFPYYAFNSTADNAARAEGELPRVVIKNPNRLSLDISVPKWSKRHWIQYYFNDDLLEGIKPLVKETVKYYAEHTCLHFKEITKDQTATRHHIKIKHGSGCSSSIGFYAGGQNMTLGQMCLDRGVPAVMHEFGHALGLHHAQWRYDRDEYLHLNYSNVYDSRKYNYAKGDKAINENYGLPYDYLSLMQYPDSRYFAIDKSVSLMQPKNPLYTKSLGLGHELSFVEQKILNTYYNCAENCPTKIECQTGGFQNGKKCNECVCPIGFGGPICAVRAGSDNPSTDCGASLEATSEWQTLKGNAGVSCTWWIEAGSKEDFVEIEIVDVENKNDIRCYTGGIQVKVDNPLVTGFIVCKNEMIPDVHPIVSDKNRVIIQSYTSDNRPQKFTIKYRRVLNNNTQKTRD